MEKYIYTLFFILGVTFSTTAHSTNQDAGHLALLQSLIDNNITYSNKAGSDSIILWVNQLSPSLEKKKQYETLFQLKAMTVSAYAARGDISMAVDYARQMYEQAKKMNYLVGIYLSSRAIGDAYLNANMEREAVESYRESLQQLDKIQHTDVLKIQVLPKLIMSLLKEGETDEAGIYLKQLESLCLKEQSPSTRFFILACNAYYSISIGDLNKAKVLLDETLLLCEKYNCTYHKAILSYIQARYYLVNKEYDLAMQQYKQLLATTPADLASNKYVQLKQEQAKLFSQMGQVDEACRIYKETNTLKDSLNTQSYTRQINNLRAAYQVDQLEIQRQIQHNQLTLGAIIFIFSALLLILLLTIRIKKENKRLRRSQEKLEKARRYAESSIQTKSLFLSNMSHEIRTPLNALSGFSSILTDESIDDATRQQCNDIIQQNSELLLKLINDVIDLSNLDITKLTFSIKECDAVMICRNVIDTVKKVKQTNADVEFITTLDSLSILTDDARLQQVLINLLINATKFTSQGMITLKLEKESDTTALFSISDTGCGIPLEKQSRIFNRFEKLNESAQGTGLGLSICQLIIEQAGGRIWIDSLYTEGARFCFTHPIHATKREETKQ